MLEGWKAKLKVWYKKFQRCYIQDKPLIYGNQLNCFTVT